MENGLNILFVVIHFVYKSKRQNNANGKRTSNLKWQRAVPVEFLMNDFRKIELSDNEKWNSPTKNPITS